MDSHTTLCSGMSQYEVAGDDRTLPDDTEIEESGGFEVLRPLTSLRF